MNARDAVAEIAVRPLRFGDPVLIEAKEVLAAIEELRLLLHCEAGHEFLERLDHAELRRQLSVARNRAAARREGRV